MRAHHLLALVLLAFTLPRAHGQFIAPRYGSGATITSVPVSPAYTPYAIPSFGIQPAYPTYGYYPGLYYSDPVSGYFNGIANLTSAYGQYAINYNQARLLNQDVERSKLATRRAIIEQQIWEQSLQPTREEIERRRREADLRRALNDPPLTEIVTGDALNTLLKNIQDMQAKGGYGPPVPLDEELLKHINISATAGSNIALFKDGGKLNWPFVLRDDPYNRDREEVQDLVNRALREAKADELTPATIRELKAAIARIDDTLSKKAPEMSIPDSIQARRYVDELKDAVRALEHPSASSFLNKKYQATGRSVGDLVLYMTRNGLRFAPALTGEESSYRALHNALVSYSYGTAQSVRRQ